MSKRKKQLREKPTQEFTTIGTADGGNLGDFEPGHNMRIFSQNSEDWTILISLNIELRGSKMCGALLGPERCLCRMEENKAGYTATEVACGWAGATFVVTKQRGQEQ